MPTPTIHQLKRAIEISERIASLQAELADIFGGKGEAVSSSSASAAPKRKGKRNMSPEARERIAAAQRARWAKARGGAAPKAAAKAPKGRKKKRNLSPEGRARIVAALKARWAKRKTA